MTMNSKFIRTLALAGGTLAVAGCATGSGEDFMADTTWGEANRRTMAAQVIDPNPVYEDPIPPTSADNAVDAIDRLRNDQVKQPERVSTTETPD